MLRFFLFLFFCCPEALQGGLEPEETLRDVSCLEFCHWGDLFSGRGYKLHGLRSGTLPCDCGSPPCPRAIST